MSRTDHTGRTGRTGRFGKTKTGDSEADADWMEAIEEIDRALRNAEDIPEEGEEFADGVTETLEDIRQTIERTQRVTDRQWEAVQNMASGISRWL